MFSIMAIANQNEIMNWKENEQFNSVYWCRKYTLLIFITILKSPEPQYNFVNY